MIEIDDNARRAIDNVRALLDAMLASGWEQACVTGKDGDYFLARQPGTPNPLLAAPEEAALAQPAVAPIPAECASLTVCAPHVGTVAWLAPIGAVLAEGAAAARLAVLDDQVDVPSPKAGTVTAQSAQIGDLAEFSTPLVLLAG